MGNYYNALAQVDTILDYLDENEYRKIPTEIIETIKENKSKDYIFNYDEDLELKEQKLLTETKAILFNLFRDYLATSEQKEKIIKMQREDRIKTEKQKSENYQYKELFSRQTSDEVNMKNKQNEDNELLQMVEYKEPFLTRIGKWVKNLFYKI